MKQNERKHNMHLGWIFFVMLAGTVMPIQAGFNSQLSKNLASPAQAAFISFLGGVLCMAVYCIISGAFFPSFSKLAKMPPLLLTGGLWGCVMILTAIFFAPRIGAATLVSCLITGQLLCSVLLDHFGVIGYTQHSTSPTRMLGVFFLLVGVFLIRKF